MVTKYIQAAMRRAHYEILKDDGTFYGSIPELPGVWANRPLLEACREELEEVLEDWILLGISRNTPIPPLDGIELMVREVA
jgi:predicted RNase H-like HicB family nuclease